MLKNKGLLVYSNAMKRF